MNHYEYRPLVIGPFSVATFEKSLRDLGCTRIDAPEPPLTEDQNGPSDDAIHSYWENPVGGRAVLHNTALPGIHALTAYKELEPAPVRVGAVKVGEVEALSLNGEPVTTLN